MVCLSCCFHLHVCEISQLDYVSQQVSQWGPELIAQEYEAKQTARVLLFVIDNQTRNSAGIIEAAQLAATRSESLVLVIYPYRQGQTILGETVSTQYVVSYD